MTLGRQGPNPEQVQRMPSRPLRQLSTQCRHQEYRQQRRHQPQPKPRAPTPSLLGRRHTGGLEEEVALARAEAAAEAELGEEALETKTLLAHAQRRHPACAEETMAEEPSR